MSITTAELIALLNSQKSVSDYLQLAEAEMQDITLAEFLNRCLTVACPKQ